ncbi:family 2 encapsulin nanocompartment cargo protein polyprenyl transferase [Actinomadura atramentaria]|uniref:family 2 encapsulin nanocompartment cargo protein polyprenyl transferase n=1 Tax=Actinomadura atramentaria TaxID=1990 RepID=UPI000376B848|nr:family 2 encapsulin nanocompartment cargo protein polyprenyl transferase [Actinomadura atramentaria]
MSAARETTRGRPAAEILRWSRALLDPALRAAVGELSGEMRGIAEYHFGWRDAAGGPADAPAGKAVRPALAFLAAEAVGGGAADAVPAAVAIELAHNFSLLHDDVMDGDTERRHRATAWSLFGATPAVLAGDALLACAVEGLAADTVGGPAVRTFGRAVRELVEGQSADISFERRADVTLAECEAMAAKKTGALIGGACALGAIFGGGSPARVARLRGFGERVGLAFQIVDDLLGIWGDAAVTGKPVHSDLVNRKKSLPVVAALTSGTSEAAELAALYHRAEPLAAPDAARAADLVARAGGRAWANARAAELRAEALTELDAAAPAPSVRDDLAELARLLTDRDH